jgi:hypothetical protein
MAQLQAAPGIEPTNLTSSADSSTTVLLPGHDTQHKDTQHNDIQHNTLNITMKNTQHIDDDNECSFAECLVCFIVMLSVFMPSVRPLWGYDTQHGGAQYLHIQHNNNKTDTQHNHTQHNDAQYTTY